jgi:hypothetical protein
MPCGFDRFLGPVWLRLFVKASQVVIQEAATGESPRMVISVLWNAIHYYTGKSFDFKINR